MPQPSAPSRRMQGLMYFGTLAGIIVAGWLGGSLIVSQINAAPDSRAFWGAIGPLLGTAAITVMFVSKWAGVWRPPRGARPSPLHRARMVALRIIATTFGVPGLVLSLGAMFLEDDMGRADDAIMGGLFSGFAVFIGVSLLLYSLLDYRPSRKNSNALYRDRTLVTSTYDDGTGGIDGLRVISVPTFLGKVGLATITLDGVEAGMIAPGDGLGITTSPGPHKIEVQRGVGLGAAPLRATVTVKEGEMRTASFTTSLTSALLSLTSPSTGDFRLQVPDGSSKFATGGTPTGHTLGSPGPGQILGSASDPPFAMPSVASAPRHGNARLTAAGSSISALARDPWAAINDTAPDRTRGARAYLPLVATALGALVVGVALRAVGGDLPSIIEVHGDEDFSAFLLPSLPGVLLMWGAWHEIRRVATFAPLRRYPGGLLFTAIALAGAVSGTIVRSDTIDDTYGLFFAAVVGPIALAQWWFNLRRYSSPSPRSIRDHQGSWVDQPTLVSAVTGPPVRGGGAIRVVMQSFEEWTIDLGLEGQNRAWLLSDMDALAIPVRAGSHRVMIAKRGKPRGSFTVAVAAGEVVTVRVGEFAPRLLWLVPPGRRVYAAVEQRVIGPIELSSD